MLKAPHFIHGISSVSQLVGDGCSEGSLTGVHVATPGRRTRTSHGRRDFASVTQDREMGRWPWMTDGSSHKGPYQREMGLGEKV